MHFSARTTMHHQPLTHELVIEKLGLLPHMMLADIGAGGGGQLTLALARHLKDGIVIAHDIQPMRLDIVRQRAHAYALHNIAFVLDDIEKENGLPVNDERMDGILMVNVLHQLDSRHRALQECARALAAGGRMLIVEWDEQKTFENHALQDRLLTPHEVRATADGSPLTHIDTFHISPYYWGMILEKV